MFLVRFELFFILTTIFKKASTANLYLNSIIAYEIFILLRNNKQVVRHKPPSLRNVTLKAMVVYMFSIVVFAINMTLEHVADEQKYIEYDFGKGIQASLSILLCNILVTYVIPIGFFFYVSIIIKIRNYLPSISGRERELVSIFHPWVIWFVSVSVYLIFYICFLLTTRFVVVALIVCVHFSRYFSSALLYVSASSGYRECAWW